MEFNVRRNALILAVIALAISFSSCSEQRAVYLSPGKLAIDQISLLEGPWYDAMELDLRYLRSLDPERLLVHFKKVSGIPTDAAEYGGWESESRELRGHSIGHYLSAASRMYKLTGDTILLNNCSYIINELSRCQKANKNGYLSAFPDEYLDRVEAMEPVWAPYYTLHKILTGLNDSYLYFENETALATALQLSHYLYKRITPLGIDKFQQVLDKTEQGGMNELFWNIYAETGDTICRALALDFYQRSYFEPMTHRVDKLAGQHSNSLIPNVVGIAREYEVTGDITRRQMAEWFWGQVVNTRSYVTGGTSNGEHWNTEPWHMDTELGAGAHESCCTYNMIKLSDHLWDWNGDVKYQDYIERALINGILPTQNPESGMSMYYVSMAPGYYKTWGTPESSFWCCTGTGMENFARTAEYIYDVKDDRIYINQFISSALGFSELGLKLIQTTDMPLGSSTVIETECTGKKSFRLAVRIPSWSGNNYSVKLNGRILSSKASSGSYLMVDREWRNGDKLEITFKPSLWSSLLPVSNNFVAFGYGPVVLAARFGEAGVDSTLRVRYGPYDGGPVNVPAVQFGTDEITTYVQPVDLENRQFSIRSVDGKQIEMVPFLNIYKEYYSVYLPVDTIKNILNNRKVDPSIH